MLQYAIIYVSNWLHDVIKYLQS